MRIDGQCHCGRVGYIADIDPDKVSVCHCTDCQVLTGSPYRISVPVARTDLRLTGQEPKAYAKRAESGRKRIQLFCPECGTPVFATGEGEEADILGIRWGSISQRRDLPPRCQVWCGSALPWIDTIGSLPGHRGE